VTFNGITTLSLSFSINTHILISILQISYNVSTTYYLILSTTNQDYVFLSNYKQTINKIELFSHIYLYISHTQSRFYLIASREKLSRQSRFIRDKSSAYISCSNKYIWSFLSYYSYSCPSEAQR